MMTIISRGMAGTKGIPRMIIAAGSFDDITSGEQTSKARNISLVRRLILCIGFRVVLSDQN